MLYPRGETSLPKFDSDSRCSQFGLVYSVYQITDLRCSFTDAYIWEAARYPKCAWGKAITDSLTETARGVAEESIINGF